MEARGNESSARVRGELAALLERRGKDAEAAIVAHYRNSELGREGDAEAAAALPLIVGEVVKFVRQQLEEGDSWTAELPPLVAGSIHHMARIGMSLDEAVRSYTVTGAGLTEFIVANLGELDRPEEAMRYMMSQRGVNEDRMMAAFAAEYAQELERLSAAPSRQLAERVQGLLNGGSGDFSDLEYRLDAWHIGLVAQGPKGELLPAAGRGAGLRAAGPATAARNGLGLARRPSPDRLRGVERAVTAGENGTSIAAGEPRRGLDGWRRSHREAREAAAVTLLGAATLARYSDEALLVTALGSEVAGRALLDRYIVPLDGRHDGAALRETLRAYLDLDCNAASTAAALGVDRHTVKRRLGRIEEAVGESVSARRTEFDVALRLEGITETIAQLADGDSIDHLVPVEVLPRTEVVRHKQRPR